MDDKKVIIVEGLSDKTHLQKIINEDIDIICTHGTFGIEKFEEMLETYDLDNREVYIFVDADDSGVKLRKQLTAELPTARQMYIPDECIEVELTPKHILAAELMKHYIKVIPSYFGNKKG
ncbi:toprim domain-containing protein [Pseudogracilibacillus auburnensis]|uniref:Toprim domain protein n=1 Tax=Pseudogracilibacillus auburnensis TaxID=1494959 RepID=A0A2V3VI08_9BACI|nr:toprim domain-containing protein [Pseudogracilibacillus auburnensis]PXW81462.1 toprim domain protein [Pseudogracilibacillus auburnensis]